MKTFMLSNLPARPPKPQRQKHPKKANQETYNTPLEHTPGNPLPQLWKDSLYNLLVKVARGVFQRCVETTLEAKTPGKFIAYPHLRRWFSSEICFVLCLCFVLQV